LPIPVPGPAVPRWGNVFTRTLGRAAIRLFGWNFGGTFPDVAKCVFIGAPHTSNWDFLFAIAAVLAIGFRFHWLGKHTLFKPPFGRLFYWLNGIPVDRRAAVGVVEQAVARFEKSEQLILGVAPEGTRRRVEHWKSGFHRIALGAKVPILPINLDYRTRTIYFHPLFTPTPDYERDLAFLLSLYDKRMARYPENFGQ